MGKFAKNLNFRQTCPTPPVEALKGLLFKNAQIFKSHFCRKCHATIPEHDKVDPLDGLNLKV